MTAGGSFMNPRCKNRNRWVSGGRRKSRKISEPWPSGINRRNYQRPAANRIDDGKRNQMLKLAREVYPDFNMGHCLEMLAERDNLMTSYATFHRWCRMAGIAKRKRRRTPKARVHRERMANEGLPLQLDGTGSTPRVERH